MDFELSDEQRLIRETARAFTDNEIVERARENDRNEHFDLELVEKIAAQGYLGAIVYATPEECRFFSDPVGVIRRRAGLTGWRRPHASDRRSSSPASAS